MPPLQRDFSPYERPATPDQLKEQELLWEHSQHAYGLMQDAVPIADDAWHRFMGGFFPRLAVRRTKAAVYQLDKQPDFRQQRAWLERHPGTNAVSLKTQVFETFNNRLARSEQVMVRAVARGGHLVDFAPNSFTFEQRKQLLTDIEDTVAAINALAATGRTSIPLDSTTAHSP